MPGLPGGVTSAGRAWGWATSGRVGARGDKANAFEREENLAQSAQIFRALRSEHYAGAEGDFILALDARQPSEEVTRQVLARVGALLRAKLDNNN